jgi:hypothetical protein
MWGNKVLRNWLKRIAATSLVLALLVMSILVVVSPVSAVGNTYYVATNGDDAAAGSIGAPWKTPQHAIDTATTAGDIVYFRGGTYNVAGGHLSDGLINFSSGSAGNPILFSAYPSESPVFDFNTLDLGNYSGIFINGASYISWTGIEIKNCRTTTNGGSGIHVYGNGSNYVFTDMITHDTDRSGILASKWDGGTGISNVTIDGCICYNNCHLGWGEALSLVNIDTFEIKNCTVYDVQGIDHYEHNKEGICVKQGCANGSIHHNEVYATRMGIYIGGTTLGAHNIEVYVNKIHDNIDGDLEGYGITLGVESAADQTCDEIDIYNNLIYNNTSRGFHINAQAASTYNFSLINNTFYQNGDSEIWCCETNTTFVTCVIRNNILWSEAGNAGVSIQDDTTDLAQFTIDHNLFWDGDGTLSASNHAGTDSVVADPLFVNAGTDFSLSNESPAIDAGVNTAAPATDYLGRLRPQGIAFDIGAYEVLYFILVGSGVGLGF